jgi:hypothetical protein
MRNRRDPKASQRAAERAPMADEEITLPFRIVCTRRQTQDGDDARKRLDREPSGFLERRDSRFRL